MIDSQRFAALICDWCLEVEAGQKVLISTTTLAQEPALALLSAITARGAWASLALDPPGSRVAFLEHAGPELLEAANPFRLAAMETADALLRLDAPANTRELAGIDPARLARQNTANRRFSEIQMSRRWAVSIWPTAALAQEAGMSERDYGAFLERALFLDQPDPMAAWQRLRQNQQGLVDRLSVAREVRIVSERTDITLGVAGRTWRNSDGKRNMPSGEVFTSPHETSANGHVFFDLPRTCAARTSAGSACASSTAWSPRPTPSRATRSSRPSSTLTPGPGGSANSASAPTSASTGPPARRCWTRRSAAPSISLWVAPTPSAAGRTTPPSTGTSSATCAGAGRSSSTVR